MLFIEGDLAGKICVILDIVDQNRVSTIHIIEEINFYHSMQALVDGPFKLTGVKRQQIPLKRLSRTPIKVGINRSKFLFEFPSR